MGADRPQTPVLASVRKARGNAPERVRGSKGAIEVEKTSIRAVVTVTTGQNHPNA